MNVDRIKEIVNAADLNVLRLALLHATGDDELARMKVAEYSAMGGSVTFRALAPEHEQSVRDKAIAFIAAGCPVTAAAPSPADLRRYVEMFLGGPTTDAKFQFLSEELALNAFPRAVSWQAEPSADARADFRVVIIGAGFSGIALAVQLEQLGVAYRIIERQSDIGGTWVLNNYPGARVDVPSAAYRFTFEKNYPWENNYATREQNARYLQHCAAKFGVTPHVSFETELIDAAWDDAAGHWSLTLRGPDGAIEHTAANVLVSAAGFFSKPHLPAIPGLTDFQGEVLRTTGWNEDFDWSGKRLALVGTGSSGAQVMPAIAEKAASLTVFQRTPQWIMTYPGYFDRVPDNVKWLRDNVPFYWNWHGVGAIAPLLMLRDQFLMDADWQREGGKVSKVNDGLRQALIENIHAQLADRPDLIAKSIPDYAPWGRRVVVDSGWFDALKRPNVELVTDPIECFTPRGVRTADGAERPLDAIVLATGFETTEFLHPVNYRGRNGVGIDSLWAKDGPRSYLSLVMPGFPNFFMIYGAPNGQPIQGVMSSWAEIWSRYVAQAIVTLIESGHRSMDCRREVFEAYNRDLDRETDKMLWQTEGKSGYYVNSFGRPSANVPFDLETFLPKVSKIDPKDYTFSD